MHRVFVAACGLSLVMASGGYIFTAEASLVVADFLVVVHRLSCSVACGIFLEQGLNLCPLHWLVNS